jgi:apolipoprotein N-acyltransferase
LPNNHQAIVTLSSLLNRLHNKVQFMVEFLCLFAAGSLITLSLAPFNYWPLALLAMIVLHLALADATPRQGMWRAAYFATGLQISGNFWVYVSMHEHGGANEFLASIMTLGLCLFLASWLLPLGYFYTRSIRDKKYGKTLGFAAFWIFSEWLKTSLLTGFPWLFLGYSQLHAPLHDWAPVIGTFGISFILSYSAAVISTALITRKIPTETAMVIVLWLMPLLLANIEWTQKKNDKAYSVALIQPNIDLEDKWDPDNREPIMNYFRQITRDLKNTDLVIWPETALPDLYHNIPDYLAEIDAIANDNNSAVIMGIASKWYHDDEPVYHNSIVAMGKGSGLYHKQKLVPFGEFVPLEEWLRGLIQFFDLPMSQFSAGLDNQDPLKAHDLVIMPYICYEVVYPDFVAQSAGAADILLTVSNDAWFGTSIGPLQHMQMAQMRALETGRYMIRDTNNGVTAVINHNGDSIAELPQFKRQVLKADVYAYQGLTPVARYGTLPVVIFSMVILLLLWRLPSQNTPKSE